MGELTVDAGDLVIGDRDGVVVVRRGQLGEDQGTPGGGRNRGNEDARRGAAGEIRSLLDSLPEVVRPDKLPRLAREGSCLGDERTRRVIRF